MRFRPSAIAGTLLVLIGFSLAAGNHRVEAQAPPRLTADEELSANGEVRSRFVIAYSRADYDQLKRRVPDPNDIAELGVEADVDAVMTAAAGSYDEPNASVVVTMTQAGAAKNRGGGRWEYSVEMEDSEVALLRKSSIQDRTKFEFQITGGVGGTGSVTLPPGATDATWDQARSMIGYTLPSPAKEGPARLVLRSLSVNRRLMGAVYKAYADRQRLKKQWTAKAVFANEGSAPVDALRVRFRLNGYSEWGPYERSAEVASGQTVVASFYPQLDSKVAALRSPVTAALEIEWTYRDPSGRDVTDGDTKPIQILGGNQFVLKRTVGRPNGGSDESQSLQENGEMLTAWITPEDPVVREFASWATRRAKGAAPGQTPNDSADLSVLRSIWELWLDNDFAYQSPGTFVEATGASKGGKLLKSFDETQVQTIRFPRDTIKDRSGTCLETAVLYASMAKAAGLREAGIVLLPDHAFPFFIGTSGKAYAVESTMIGGGKRSAASANFDQALQAGMQQLSLVQKGQYPGGPGVSISMSQGRSVGIFPPELEPPPPNALQSWGLRPNER